MTLAERALETMRRHRLARHGERVLVGVSGGADSVALLWLLRELAASGALELAGVAHLNHQLRGAEADGDEAFCAGLAARVRVPFVSDRVDVAAIARAQKRSVEDAARVARYAFFERAADAVRADVIAVAHTRDDQAETFLLRLIRGSATRGLAAIRPRAGRVIRPLLEIERATLREYLAARGEMFREDATNADVAIPRNRVRHELIPYLRSQFSPGVSGVLARTAELARQDEEFLSAEAIKLAERIVLRDVTTRLDVSELRRAPRALGSRVVHAALQPLAGPKSIHFDHVERVLALAAGAGDGSVSLPGQSAVRVGNEIRLRPGRGLAHRSASRKDSSGEREGGTEFAFSLSIPGEVRLGAPGGLGNVGLAVAAELLPGRPGESGRHRQWAGRGAEVGVAADRLTLPLGVRSRRPGDRFRPLGAPGRRKLQDFLVDRKVAREERDTVPLVVDGRDRIVWVVGQSVAEDFRVTDPSRAVILLKVRHLGGVG